MSKNYELLWSKACQEPWMILPAKLQEIMGFLEAKVRGETIPPEVVAALKRDRRNFAVVGSTAVLPVFGTIIPRADMFMDISGGTSAEKLRSQIREAADDKSITGIVLDIDSPGGSAAGIPEVFDEVVRAREIKPVVAVANPDAFSAAYFIASGASEIVAIKSGEVGSIGTLILHQDLSEAFQLKGIKNTVIRSSPRKAEGNPFEPLSQEVRDELQRVVNLYNDVFERSVAQGRGVSVAKVRSEFGQGATLTSPEALSVGMIDRMQTLEEVLERMENPRKRAQIGRNRPQTIREFESALREDLGYSHEQAKRIALEGFRETEPRDEAGAPNSSEPREEADTSAAEPREEEVAEAMHSLIEAGRKALAR